MLCATLLRAQANAQGGAHPIEGKNDAIYFPYRRKPFRKNNFIE